MTITYLLVLCAVQYVHKLSVNTVLFTTFSVYYTLSINFFITLKQYINSSGEATQPVKSFKRNCCESQVLTEHISDEDIITLNCHHL